MLTPFIIRIPVLSIKAETYAKCVYSLVILKGVSYPQKLPFSSVRAATQEVEGKRGRSPANLPDKPEPTGKTKHNGP